MATKLYVGNLSFNTVESTLRTLFEADGRRVEDVSIVMDRDTGQKAIEALNGREVEGRTLTVSEAKPKTGGGGGGGGGYGGGGGGGGRGGYGR